MNIIFQVDGGIGKSIAATAVCKAIKKQHPHDTLIMVTGYTEVFFCNPNVDKVFNFNTAWRKFAAQSYALANSCLHH